MGDSEKFDYLDPDDCIPFLNMRMIVDAVKYQNTKESIRTWGVRQNVNARPHPSKPGKYEVYAGRLRLKITQELKEEGQPYEIYRLPALIKDADEFEVYAVTLTENVDRADVSPFAIGNWLQMIMMKFPMTQRELSAKVGKSQTWVSRHLKIVETMQKEAPSSGLDLEKLQAIPATERQARALRSLDPDLRQKVFKGVMDGELPSARELERRTKATATADEILARYSPAEVEDEFLEYLLQEEAGLIASDARKKVREWRWGRRRKTTSDVKVSAKDPTVQLYAQLSKYFPYEVIDAVENLAPAKTLDTMIKYCRRYIAKLYAKVPEEIRQAVLEEWMM